MAPADAVAIVADPTTPATAEPWLAAFAAARRLPFLRVDSMSPGASWNAGLSAVGTVDFAICVDSGESLDPSGTRRHDAADVFKSVPCRRDDRHRVGGPRHTTYLHRGSWMCSPLDILADPMAVHVSSLFRWPLWKASAGFDEEMSGLDTRDLRGRALGRTVAALPLQKVRRCCEDESRGGRSIDAPVDWGLPAGRPGAVRAALEIRRLCTRRAAGTQRGHSAPRTSPPREQPGAAARGRSGNRASSRAAGRSAR